MELNVNSFHFYSHYENIILSFMSYWMIFVGFVTFCFLLKYNAPYGRYSNYIFDLQMPVKVAWPLMTISPVLTFVIFLFIKDYFGVITFNYFYLLYVIHYFNRSLIYPNLIKDGKPMPLVPFALAFVFHIYNSSLQLVSAFNSRPSFGFLNIIGILGFFIGMFINITSDYQLRNLRKCSTDSQRYKIPKGFLFEYVSCANYFGEIVEWLSYALAMQSLASIAFAMFTVFNLLPRSISHHRWYVVKFEKYPRNRKAIIPFIL